ncbi:MAG: hypothetical protein WD845_03880, partial [Pirellulales bacterium]
MSQLPRFELAVLLFAGAIVGCAPKNTPPAEAVAAPEARPSAADEISAPSEAGRPVTGPALGEPAESATEPAAAATDGKPASAPQGIAVDEPHPQTPPAAGADVQLIPREVLFGNPDKASARISPDGTQLSFLAPLDGVLNVFVAPIDDPGAAKPVTDDKYRGIRAYFWAFDSQHLLYIQDKGGDEDWHVYSVDLTPGETKDLTPIDKVNAQVVGLSEKFPAEILIGLNDRDARYHDIHRVNIASGERQLVQQNPDFASFVTDDDYQVRFATKYLPDGGMQLYEPDGEGGWKEFEKIPFEDTLTTGTLG